MTYILEWTAPIIYPVFSVYMCIMCIYMRTIGNYISEWIHLVTNNRFLILNNCSQRTWNWLWFEFILNFLLLLLCNTLCSAYWNLLLISEIWNNKKLPLLLFPKKIFPSRNGHNLNSMEFETIITHLNTS